MFMKLNDYKDEVKDFMKRIDAFDKNTKQKISWLEKEFELLKISVDNSKSEAICHQIYDMIYLLLEIAADNDCDLDSEWNKGAKKKQEKYINKYFNKV